MLHDSNLDWSLLGYRWLLVRLRLRVCHPTLDTVIIPHI